MTPPKLQRLLARAVMPLALVAAACSVETTHEDVGRNTQAASEYGNNHDDIVWQDFRSGTANQGQVGLWYSYGNNSNNTWRGSLPNYVGAGWNVRLDGDFYGDGKSALLLQANDGGPDPANPNQRFMLWRLASGAVTDTPVLATGVPGEWTVVSAIDVDDDGHDDILWQNLITGDLAVWFMHDDATPPTRVTVAHYAPSPTTLALDAGRFDGVTPAVLLWDRAHQLIQTVSLSHLGTSVYAYPVSTVRGADAAWNEVGVGDVDGDGKSDVIWFNPSTHLLGEWLMTGFFGTSSLASTGYAYAGYAGSTLVPIQVGDYDGNGRADVLWRDTATTEMVIWNIGPGGNGQASAPNFGAIPCKWMVAKLGTHGDASLACASHGGPGQSCYGDGSCDPGISCMFGTCFDPNQCGSLGMLCCSSGNACDSNSQCMGAIGPIPTEMPSCKPKCGHDGEPGCYDASGPFPGYVCFGTGGSYLNRDPGPLQGQLVCDSKCSTFGHPACTDGSQTFIKPFCYPNVTTDQYGTFECTQPAAPPPPTPCGQPGERCCIRGEGNGTACGATGTNSFYTTECRNNVCTACGKLGEQCCITPNVSPCWGDLATVTNDPSLQCVPEGGGAHVCTRGMSTGMGPDLTFDGTPGTEPAFAMAGAQFKVTWQDVNIGNVGIAKYIDTITITPPANGDVITKDIPMAALGGSPATSADASFSFTSNSPGTYAIHIRVNSGGIPEANRGNNDIEFDVVAQ